MTDASGNVDQSGNTNLTGLSVTGLETNGIYTIQVCAGVTNPFNNQNYYNDVNCPQIVAALYNTPPAAGFLTIYGSQVVGSSGALLVNLTDASAVSGLTLSQYRLQVATDASFANIIQRVQATHCPNLSFEILWLE